MEPIDGTHRWVASSHCRRLWLREGIIAGKHRWKASLENIAGAGKYCWDPAVRKVGSYAVKVLV